MDRYSRICFLKGQSLDDCFALVEYSLYEDFKDTEEMEWCLFHLLDGRDTTLLTGPGEADDLWVSPAGVIYLIARTMDGYGLQVGRPIKHGYVWKLQDSVKNETTYVRNVWGLSEEAVICWGGGVLTPSTTPDPELPPIRLDAPTCWIKSGDNWMEHSSPGWIFGMGGASVNALIAVGEKNLIADWNGRTWKKDVHPPSMDLSFVQVLPTGEIYGAAYYGRVFKRTKTAWKEVGQHLGHIYGLVQWQEKVFIATGHGLYRIEGEEIVVERPHLDVRRIWAGKTLLWSDEQVIYEISGNTERSITALKSVKEAENY